MRYKDHISVGLLVYISMMRLELYKLVPITMYPIRATLGKLLVPGGLRFTMFYSFVAFMFGVVYPDFDIEMNPKLEYMPGGHRMNSKLHRLDIPLILLIIVNSGLWYYFNIMNSGANIQNQGVFINFVRCFQYFILGWLAHLVGDFIQGGFNAGFGTGKRIGFTKFNWYTYDTSAKSKAMMIAVLIYAVMAIPSGMILNIEMSRLYSTKLIVEIQVFATMFLMYKALRSINAKSFLYSVCGTITFIVILQNLLA